MGCEREDVDDDRACPCRLFRICDLFLVPKIVTVKTLDEDAHHESQEQNKRIDE
jgi:hypothetical protein